MKKQKSLYLGILVVMCFYAKTVQAQVLSGSSPSLPQLHAQVLAWADYDSDSKPDLLMMGLDSAGNGQTLLLRNTGSSFYAVSQPFPSLTEPSADWADIDNDGDPDLLLAGRQGAAGHASLWINNGGSFTRQMDALPQLRVPSIKFADFDGDGDQDCFLSGLEFNRGQVMVLMENEAGHFSEVYNSGFEQNELVQSHVEIGQAYGNSFPEIIVQGLDSLGDAKTQLWLNTGTLHFTLASVGIPGLYGGSNLIADANNDGLNDLLFCGNGPRNYSKLMLADSAIGFVDTLGTGIPEIGTGTIIRMDFNGDGLLDLIAAGETPTGTICKALKGQGGLVFVDNQTGSPLFDLHNPKIAVVDWDSDGYEDFVISGQNAQWTPVTILYRWNNLANRFEP